MKYTYINGQWCLPEEADINVQERGFRFGDGVFESIRVQQGKPLFLSKHLARLQEGLRAVRITKPAEDIEKLCFEALQRNQFQDGVLRIYASRGIGSMGYRPAADISPTLVIETLWMPALLPKPLCLWVSSYERPSLKALPVNYKLAQGLNSTLARMEATDHECDEALMLNAAGDIAEASSACIFWQDKAGQIYTPALGCGALAGIGRAVLLENMKVQEGYYPLSALNNATSVILVSAVTGIRRVEALQPQGWRWESEALFATTHQIWQECLENQLQRVK